MTIVENNILAGIVYRWRWLLTPDEVRFMVGLVDWDIASVSDKVREWAKDTTKIC